jgi:hypothetical protein
MKETLATTPEETYRACKERTWLVVLEKVKCALYKNGMMGIRGMARVFKRFDSFDGNRKIDRQEFYVGVKELGVDISKKEAEVAI